MDDELFQILNDAGDSDPEDDLASILSESDEGAGLVDERAHATRIREGYGPGGLADTTPLKDPPGTIDARLVAEPGKQPKPDAYGHIPLAPDPEELKATKAGVAIDNPAPAGHALASLAIDDNERVKAYRIAITEKLGEAALVDIGPDTGRVEWLDPKTNIWAEADPPQFGKHDIAGMAGGAVVMAPELLGNVALGPGGAALGRAVVLGSRVSKALDKSPGWAALGGGAGAFVGELTRLYLGRKLGINQEMTDEQALSKAKQVGGLSAVVGLGANVMLGTAQFIKRAMDGDAVGWAARHYDDFQMQIEDAAKLQEEFDKVIAADRPRAIAAGEIAADTPSPKLKLSMGTATGDIGLMTTEEYFRRSPRFQKEFGEYDIENQEAMKAFDRAISRDFEQGAMGGNETVKALNLHGEKALNRERDLINDDYAYYEAESRVFMDNINTRPMGSLGEVSELVGEAEAKFLKENADAAADAMRAMTNGRKIIGLDDTSKAFNTLDERAANIQIPALEAGTRRAQMLPEKLVPDAEGNMTLGALYDGNTKWTFEQAWATSSRLKEVLRDGTMSNLDRGALTKVIAAIDGDMNRSMNGTTLAPMWQSFRKWYAVEQERLNEGIVGKILDKNGKIASSEVYAKVFPTVGPIGGYGVEKTQQFMDLIKHDPQAVQAFRLSVVDHWREKVYVNGKIDKAASERWFRDHEGQLGLTFGGASTAEKEAADVFGFGARQPAAAGDPLFTAKEIAQAQKAEDWSGVLAARQQVRDDALAALNKSMGWKLANLEYPGQLVNLMKIDPEGNVARQVMKHIDGLPDVKRGVQAALLRDYRAHVGNQTIKSTGDMRFAAAQFRKYMDGKGMDSGLGMRPVFGAVFGGKHLANIDVLHDGIARAALEAPYPNYSSSAMWGTNTVEMHRNLRRLLFGTLNVKARVAGSIAALAEKRSSEALQRLYFNPELLKKFVKVWEKDIRNREVAVVAAQLGIGPIEMQPEVGDEKRKATRMTEFSLGL
jgi:hypothetical protein